jgi:histidine triad (HIT) family protein
LAFVLALYDRTSFKSELLFRNFLKEKDMSTHEQQQIDCFICRKHRSEIVVPGGAIYEDDLLYASHIGNFQPQEEQIIYLGYLMVETKRHIPGLADLTNIEAQAIGLLVTRLSRALKGTLGAEHIYEFVLGHHVPHLHIHIVPRYPGTPREYWGMQVDEWPDAPHGGTEEIAALATHLRAYLESEG